MKKSYIFGVAVVICFLMLGIVSMLNIPVKNSLKDENQSEKVTIVTSFYPIYLLTQNITAGAENIEIVNLTGVNTGCLHDYQLTSENMITLGQADFFIINGLHMESFLDKAVSTYPDLYVIDSSKGIETIGENPHIWLSIENYTKQAENIKNELVEKDPKNAEMYKTNTNKYIAKLNDLKNEISKKFQNCGNKNVLLFHEGFEYFAKEFGLNVLDVIENGEGAAPSAGELAEVIDKVKQYTSDTAKLKYPIVILVEPQYDFASATTISRETGAKIEEIDTVVSGDLNEVDRYIIVMKSNADILAEVLK